MSPSTLRDPSTLQGQATHTGAAWDRAGSSIPARIPGHSWRHGCPEEIQPRERGTREMLRGMKDGI